MTHYQTPAPLMQSIVDILNTLPAGQVRGLLNQIEAMCHEQDQAHAQAEREAIEKAAREKMRAELQASLPTLDA